MKHKSIASLLGLVFVLSILLLAITQGSPAQAQKGKKKAPRAAPTVTKKLNADRVDNFHASANPKPNRLLALDGNSKFPDSTIPDSIQRRVSGTCAPGSSILGINANGTVDCGVGESAVAAGTWNLTGNAATNPASNFVGTTDNQPLVFRTNNAERLRILGNGNVGIGTSAPADKLVIQTASGKIGWRHTDGTITVGSYVGGSASGAVGGWLGTVSNNDLHFFTNNGQPSLTIRTNGRVGIGTATPSQTLEVNGVTAMGLAGGVYGYRVGGAGPFYPTLGFNTYGPLGGGSYLAGVAGYGGMFQFQNGDGKLIYYTGSNVGAGAGHAVSARMTIDTSGRVGVGTTSPTQTFEVNGVTSMGLPGSVYGYRVGNAAGPFFPTLGFNTYGPTSGSSYLAGAAGYGGLFQFQNSDGKLIYYTGSNVGTGATHTITPRMTIDTFGRVGIGTSNPLAKLHIRGAADSNPFQVQDVNGNVALNVDPVGNVQVRLAGNNVSGVCYGGGYTLSICSSAAEYVPTIDGGKGFPQTADLVSIAPNIKNPYGDAHGPFVVEKSTTACDSNLLGYIVNPESGADGKKLNDHYLPLAIYGYFPAKVTMENGAIKRGDPLTSSSKPGYAMKATGACKIIGYALEDAAKEGQIQVFADAGESTAAEVTALRVQVDALTDENQALKKTLEEMNARLTALERAEIVGQQTVAR